MLSRIPAFVSTPEMACDAIHRFGEEIRRSPELARRLAYVHAWYADRDEHGHWRFAPSKFIGYEGLDAATYLELSRRGLDGRKTEARLRDRNWFVELDSSSDLYYSVLNDLCDFLAKYGRVARRGIRIHLRKGE